MWVYRLLLAALVIFVQLLFLADVFDDLAADSLFDPNWAAVFAPTLFWLALASLLVIGRFVQAGYFAIAQTSTEPAPGQYADASAIVQRQLYSRTMKVYFWDGVVDGSFVVLITVFFILVILNLEAMDSGDELRSWGVVFVPLFILLTLLLVIFALAGLRVHGEKRYDAPINNGDVWCGAVFGGVVMCCKDDDEALDKARDARREKRPQYEAKEAYHALPCAYLCTPALAYGPLDLAFSWLLYLTIVAVLIASALGAARLDSAGGDSPSVAEIFIALWVVEGLLVVVALGLFLSLLCCYRRVRQRPRGRNNILAKYAEVVAVLIIGSLLIVQQVLLSERLDGDSVGDVSWNVVFAPLYVALGFALFFGCCAQSFCSREAQARKLRALQQNDSLSYSTGRPPPKSPRIASSMWGLFGAPRVMNN